MRLPPQFVLLWRGREKFAISKWKISESERKQLRDVSWAQVIRLI